MCVHKDSIKFLANIARLVRQGLGKVIRSDAKKPRDVLEDRHICDISGNVTGITFRELKVTKKEDGDEQAENGSHVLRFETQSFHVFPQLVHGNGVIAEWPRWQAVGPGRSQKGVVGRVL